MPNLGTMTKCSPELSVISSEEDSDTLVGCFVLDSFIKTLLIHLTRTDVSTSSCMVRQQYQSSSHWQGWLESTIRNPDPGIVLTKAVGVLKDLNSREHRLGKLFLFGCSYFYHIPYWKSSTFGNGSKGLGEFYASQQDCLDIAYDNRIKILFHILISPKQAFKILTPHTHYLLSQNLPQHVNVNNR